MRTILLLDDDRDLQSLVATALRQHGLQVRPAATAAQARRALEQGPVDAAIVDGLLPDMAGTDFIARLRQSHPTLPVIFASAFWRDLQSHRLLTGQLGVARVVHKPYAPAEMVAWVQELLSPLASPGGAQPLPAPALPDRPGATLEEEMGVLRAQYAARLPGRLREVRARVEEAQVGVAGALAEATTLVHRLHGTAGAYGQNEVSAQAGRLERALRQLEAGMPGEALWPHALALVQALEDAARTPAPPAPAVTTGALLLVDDNPAFLSEVERLASAHLLRVVPARTVTEAREAARRQWLDGALIHLHVGGPEEGLRLAEQLREQEGLAGLPLAFYAAAGALSDRVAAAHAGGSLFLPRPFSPRELVAVAERFAALRRPERARLLLVDDDADFLAAVGPLLAAEGHEVRTLRQPLDILGTLAACRPDLLLLDATMPGLGGLDICKVLRSMPEWQELPIILVTARTEAPFRVAAFQAGIDDYVPKPVLREELRARLQARLQRARLLRERTDRDALTGLLLRRAFLEAARSRLNAADRAGRALSLALLEVDHLRQVNDRYGHLAGDRVLARLGRLLATRLRSEDVRGRWGGGELAVLLPEEPAASARAILARTCEELAAQEFEADGPERFRITLSAGVATFPADGRTVEELLQVADARLARARTAGRNRIEAG